MQGTPPSHTCHPPAPRFQEALPELGFPESPRVDRGHSARWSTALSENHLHSPFYKRRHAFKFSITSSDKQLEGDI